MEQVDEGSHVDALDNQDRTPLHLAAAAGHSDVVQLLGSKTVDGGAEAGKCHQLSQAHVKRSARSWLCVHRFLTNKDSHVASV